MEKENTMIKRPFQNIELSRLGLGNMRYILSDPDNSDSPIDRPKAFAVIERAYQNGINYFDTAYVYNAGDSERCLGECIKQYPRDSFFIADKFHLQANPDYEAVFEEQLKRLQTDRIDFYLLHCIMDGNADSYLNSGCIDYFLKQKEAGRIRYLGFSSHAGTETLRRFADCRAWDFAQIQLNYFDWYFGTAKEEYEILTERKIPVIVMEPVRGGRLSALSPAAEELLKRAHPDWSISSWAMRFVKSLPNTQVILSGMNTVEQMDDNLKTFAEDDGLSEADQAVLRQAAELFRSEIIVPCTACRYCTEGCPMQINIPEYLRVYNAWKTDGNDGLEAYSKVQSEGTADQCIQCGACAGICPQSIEIPGLLKELAEAAAK